MEQLTITVDNSANSGLLISLLKNLSFVKWIEKKTGKTTQLPVSKFKSKEDFWETFGSGENTSVSIKHIRQNAWRKNQL